MPIVLDRPEVNPDARFGLKATAALLGVDEATIARWTRRGRMQCGVRAVNGRRFWTGAEIQRIWVNEVDPVEWRRHMARRGTPWYD